MEKALVKTIKDLIAHVVSMSIEGLVLSGYIKPQDLNSARLILLENAQRSLDNALAFDVKNETIAINTHSSK